eukprot:GHVU01012758.1.p2 GENE.GHVU01012758.1~~GHVU01012758.1.p2  ORF type:complete len:128 (-),score=25.22 GHVU01012758.1:381-764(-)
MCVFAGQSLDCEARRLEMPLPELKKLEGRLVGVSSATSESEVLSTSIRGLLLLEAVEYTPDFQDAMFRVKFPNHNTDPISFLRGAHGGTRPSPPTGGSGPPGSTHASAAGGGAESPLFFIFGDSPPK